MDAIIHPKSVTSCATVLLNIFKKRRNKYKPCKCCTCMCHMYESKDKNSSEMLEINDNKFFNCKCNHECHKLSNCKECEKLKQSKRQRPKKKIVKFQIQHTASMNSLTSPYKLKASMNSLTSPNRHTTNTSSLTSPYKLTASTNSLALPYKVCSCDKLKNTLSLCKMVHGKPCSDSLCSPVQRSLIEKNDNQERFFSPFCSEIRNKSERLSQSRTSRRRERPKSFYEWTIPFSSIELGELEALSPKGPVYRGRWHGEVMVYTRSHATSEEIEQFNNEVSLLGLIRHENVVLFMGACIEPPNLAVITSVRKGHTLYSHIHMHQTLFHFGSKFSISKQIAQGMGYLHAKGITLGKLCSKNIFLESKVKISITDYTMVRQPSVKPDYGCIPKGHLTYLSPELMKSLRKNGIYLSCSERPTYKSDVFAYGTLLYEIFLGRYPFHGVLPEIIIWKICNRHVDVLKDVEFPLIFKDLIQSCWKSELNERPEFQDILTNMRKLNIPRSLQKKLSLSDSEAIHKQQQSNGSASFTRQHSNSHFIRLNSCKIE
ncbi:kinase suppressor of Ras 2 [Hydra vulgaris]|uniref:kinase suppressor of Ras 2 n=1 Tax=Hydra vulgaris TaxID=6087 RepID=UPI001F5F88BA|nr:kinase suppressor of Ras 2 [Hydra vulgaris]